MKLTKPQVAMLIALNNGTFRYAGRKHSQTWAKLEALGYAKIDHRMKITQAGQIALAPYVTAIPPSDYRD